ncbi:hypothetical protein NHQ30_011388 [Ciborinia camelliae]|nr:hypothetical protein NHQ30_011388 [Ciborinia camelliae]
MTEANETSYFRSASFAVILSLAIIVIIMLIMIYIPGVIGKKFEELRNKASDETRRLLEDASTQTERIPDIELGELLPAPEPVLARTGQQPDDWPKRKLKPMPAVRIGEVESISEIDLGYGSAGHLQGFPHYLSKNLNE